MKGDCLVLIQHISHRVMYILLLSYACRFVREQRARLESGEKMEGAAMWALRNTGADIRLKQEPVSKNVVLMQLVWAYALNL